MITIVTPADRGKARNPAFEKFFLKRYTSDQRFWGPARYTHPLQDEFDTHEAVYVIYSEEVATYYAGLRLLPTTGLYCLKEYWLKHRPSNSLVDVYPCDPAYWECSAFFIDLPRSLPSYHKKIKRICDELLKALLKFGAKNSINHYLTFFKADEHTLLVKNSWPIKEQKTSLKIGEEIYTQGVITVDLVKEGESKKKTLHSSENSGPLSSQSPDQSSSNE